MVIVDFRGSQELHRLALEEHLETGGQRLFWRRRELR